MCDTPHWLKCPSSSTWTLTCTSSSMWSTSGQLATGTPPTEESGPPGRKHPSHNFRGFHQECTSHSTRSVSFGRLLLWMPIRKQQHASSSFVRNEFHNPNAQASGDPLLSKEDDDMTILLFPGVKLIPNVVMRIEVNYRTTFGNLNLTNFPVNSATVRIFERDCMCASFQMSRSVETCIRPSS